jgi:magnesium-transporting ATPase (P-type)
LYVKGAIEQILRLSKRYLHQGSPLPITDEKIRAFISDSNQMAAKGLRSNENNFVRNINEKIINRFVF